MKRYIPLLYGCFPFVFGWLSQWLTGTTTSTFLLSLFVSTTLFLIAWWFIGYACGKLKTGILLPTVLANLPLALALILFSVLSIRTALPDFIVSICDMGVLSVSGIMLGASFTTENLLVACIISLIPVVAVFWLGCTKSSPRSK